MFHFDYVDQSLSVYNWLFVELGNKNLNIKFGFNEVGVFAAKRFWESSKCGGICGAGTMNQFTVGTGSGRSIIVGWLRLKNTEMLGVKVTNEGVKSLKQRVMYSREGDELTGL